MSPSSINAPLVKANGRLLGPLSPNADSNPRDELKTQQLNETNGDAEPGISIRFGAAERKDVDMLDAALDTKDVGLNKRKTPGGAESKSRMEPESSENEDEPLIKRRRILVKHEDPELDANVPLGANGRKIPTASETAIGEESDSDIPIERKLVAEKKKIEKRAEKNAKTHRKDTTTLTKSVADKKQGNGIKKELDDDKASTTKAVMRVKREAEPVDRGQARKGKGKITSVKEESAEAAEGDEEEEYQWWNDPTKGDGTVKWTTLEHNGVVFPPPYEPLPNDVKMKYDGIPIMLEPEAEEVAGFFGSMLNSTQNVENPVFQKNFFMDFKSIIKETGGAKDPSGRKIDIKEFSKCDFQSIFAYYDNQRAERRGLPATEKKRLKAEKDAQEAPYMYCMWDGRKQKVGNFRVEPPALFRGRGEHPKTGRVKARVQPEQITINIGRDAPVPPPPEGHRWKEVKHDQEGTWLAMWQENINGNYKYVMLAANSDVKGQSDYKKFEKARELKGHIDQIRKDYRKNLKNELMVERQKATAVYLIDQFALRAGNEKSEDEADTVGCCSLKYENVTLKPPNRVIFDFLGKDSIRFYDEVEVDSQVFKNLKIFKKPPKKEGDEIFDRLTTSALNKHLSSYMPGLTAKVFRTYNASYTMGTLLKEMKASGTISEKVKAYNDANRRVAILCNHKRTVGASHANQMEKIGGRIKGLRYQKWRFKQMMLDLEPSLKKKKGAGFFAMDDDIDEDWVKEHQAFLVEEQRQKIQKKFDKENEKRFAEGEKEMKADELEERMRAVQELEGKFKKENKTGKIEAEGKGVTIEKIENNIAKIEQRIENMSLQAQDKEDNKEVALGTSKINYIDPRLTVVFTKRFNVPIERFFSKSLREKFEWAIKSVDADWEF